MFGTLTICRDKLNTEEQARYQSYYCGLCRTLRKKFGAKSQLILTYDCTFLAMLLHAVYESPETESSFVCFHKKKGTKAVSSDALDYAADMNLLLAYQNYADKVFDGKTSSAKRLAKAAVRSLKKDYLYVRTKYPSQAEALETYMRDLQAYELHPDDNVEYAANLTGEMLSRIFLMKVDEFREYLSKVGFYIGKFIYLSDAFEDMEEDAKAGNYNPFLGKTASEAEPLVRDLLESVMAEASAYFEMLPIFLDREILRNILYSGIWIPYAHTLKERAKAESSKDA
ncbi:MAG: hypothetical protein IK088_06915 [Lachnospiraceae bacterium]|nr:hypothetical protein [Lachnospiraceae bacterium]